MSIWPEKPRCMRHPQQSGIARTEAALGSLALLLLSLAIWRFAHTGHFALADALYCALAIPSAMLLLLVLDYTLHHAVFVGVLVFMVMVLFAFRSPAFCLGLGAGLAGVVWMQRE